VVEKLNPSGVCLCGCGKNTVNHTFFLSGHDKVAESAVINTLYGGVPQFLMAHGFGPEGENPYETMERYRYKRAGKYQPLTDRLKMEPTEEITFTFAELEDVLGEPLPRSARKRRPFWGNNNTRHMHAKAWLDAGWKVEKVSLHGEIVTFTRTGGDQNDGKELKAQEDVVEPERIPLTLKAWYQEPDGEVHIMLSPRRAMT